MLGMLMLTGGSMYIGYQTYQAKKLAPLRITWVDWLKQFLRVRTVNPRQNAGSANKTTRPVPLVHCLLTVQLDKFDADAAQLPKQSGVNELTLASVALGLITTSAAIYPPAQIVCLPLLLYFGVKPAQTAYRAWHKEGRVNLAVAETSVLVFCIMQRYYLAGALSCEAHALGRRLWQARQAQIAPPKTAWQLPTWARIQQAGKESTIPVHDLQSGDIIIVHTGEMVPVTGVVIAGVAWVKQKIESATGIFANQATNSTDIKVTIGHHIEAATIVQVGRICLAVMRDA